MGLHGKGGYWDPDYQLTLQYDTYEERAAFTREEIARRIQELGLSGMVCHCLDKVSYIVSDGTCYAPEKLNRDARQPNFLHQFVIAGERYSGALYYAADALQLCLWAFCAIGGFWAAKKDEGNVTVFRLAGFGLLLFLLIWEARSRYLVNFLLLYLLCAASAFFPCTGKEEKEHPQKGLRPIPEEKKAG